MVWKYIAGFLETVAEFQDLESLPSVKFNEEHDAEAFLKNEGKRHKICHLKFAPSKLLRLQKRKLSCEPANQHSSRGNQSDNRHLATLTWIAVSFALR